MLPPKGTRVKIVKDLKDSDDNHILLYKDQIAYVHDYVQDDTDAILVTPCGSEEVIMLSTDEYEVLP